MYKKIFISIITIIVTFFVGAKGTQYVKTDNNVEVEGIANEVQNEILEKEAIQNEMVEENTIEPVENQIIINEIENNKKNDEPKNKVTTNQNNNKTTNKTEVIEKENTEEKPKNETKVENKVENKEENKQIIENTKEPEKEQQIEQVKKETVTYNDTESKRVLDDINTIAKQNPDLWGKSGEALYKVEINKDAMINGEYTYPYSKDRIKGKILNVFPVRFMVYVVDVEKPGFAKESKYYIKLVEL